MDTACITYEGVSFEQDIFPRTKEPVWILGKEYTSNKGTDNINFFPDLIKSLVMFAGSQHCKKILFGLLLKHQPNFLALLLMY